MACVRFCDIGSVSGCLFDSCPAYDLADDKIGTYVLADGSRRVVDVGGSVIQASIADGIARIVAE